ncbi:reverse transcriptase domain-containing protein, partial [Tanacetum coccineum]
MGLIRLPTYGLVAYVMPRTFQRCMMAIFHNIIKETIEVFMDDFSVFGDSFSSCLFHLNMMLKWCEDTNVVLNWEKCHFMVKEGIVLGHKISKNGTEVDRAKVDVIAKLPHPTFVKVGAVLGKRKTKHFQPIHYASKTMEKELLAVVYAFEKFQSYLERESRGRPLVEIRKSSSRSSDLGLMLFMAKKPLISSRLVIDATGVPIEGFVSVVGKENSLPMPDARYRCIVIPGSVVVPPGSVVVPPGSVVVPPGSVVVPPGSVVVPPGSVVVTTGSVVVPPGSVVTTGSVVVPPGSVVTTGSVVVPPGSVVVTT